MNGLFRSFSISFLSGCLAIGRIKRNRRPSRTAEWIRCPAAQTALCSGRLCGPKARHSQARICLAIRGDSPAFSWSGRIPAVSIPKPNLWRLPERQDLPACSDALRIRGVTEKRSVCLWKLSSLAWSSCLGELFCKASSVRRFLAPTTGLLRRTPSRTAWTMCPCGAGRTV